MSGRRFAAVVPTLGRSPLLGESLAALAREGAGELAIVVVHSGERELALELEPAAASAVELVRPAGAARPLGFAAAANRGLEHPACRAVELVALVNDDAVVAPGWLAALAGALAAAPQAAAAQGVVLERGTTPSGAAAPERVDGCGIVWNRRWQAVQIDRGAAPPSPEDPPRAVWGVSATAALYRRAALDAVRGEDGVFDQRLDTWYEDVELAARLRAAGFGALLVPRARAVHAPSTTGNRRPFRRHRLLTANRYLVLARLLGAGLWRELPSAWLADAAEAVRAIGRGELIAAAGIAAGWARALWLLPRYAHRGGALALAPLAPLAPKTPEGSG